MANFPTSKPLCWPLWLMNRGWNQIRSFLSQKTFNQGYSQQTFKEQEKANLQYWLLPCHYSPGSWIQSAERILYCSGLCIRSSALFTLCLFYDDGCVTVFNAMIYPGSNSDNIGDGGLIRSVIPVCLIREWASDDPPAAIVYCHNS